MIRRVFVAITREVSPAIADCELTHLERTPIDVGRARLQHRAYEQALIDAGARLEQLPSDADMPDAVFVEDAAVVFDEVAVITRPGAAVRRRETAAVADALGRFRPLTFIEAPATIDGGDVLVVGPHVFVGLSSRTNAAAVEQMRAILGPRGFDVTAVAVHGCLHLKSAVTALDSHTVLTNPDWIDVSAFRGLHVVDIDPREPYAANALQLPDRIIYPKAFPCTAARIAARGYRVETVDASELAKAEGAVTCCSLIVSTTTAHAAGDAR